MLTHQSDHLASIFTERLELRPSTIASISAGLRSSTALSESLGATIPASWPPEFFDDAALRYTLDWLTDNPENAEWGLYFMIARTIEPEDHVLVGACGFKGGPDEDGTVELGYSIVPDWQGRGLATEAVLGLVRFALARPSVRRVIAQTLTTLPRSKRVLEKSGFALVGESVDSGIPRGEAVLRYELDRPPVES